MTIAFSVRSPLVSKARGRNRQKVRVLLLESLEAKQLYAVDLFEFGSTSPAIVDANQVSSPTVLANLTQSVQDPVAAARIAPRRRLAATSNRPRCATVRDQRANVRTLPTTDPHAIGYSRGTM